MEIKSYYSSETILGLINASVIVDEIFSYLTSDDFYELCNYILKENDIDINEDKKHDKNFLYELIKEYKISDDEFVKYYNEYESIDKWQDFCIKLITNYNLN
jgi:hypothetical protein